MEELKKLSKEFFEYCKKGKLVTETSTCTCGIQEKTTVRRPIEPTFEEFIKWINNQKG